MGPSFLTVLEGQIQRLTGTAKQKQLVLLAWEYLKVEDREKSKNLFDDILVNREYMDLQVFIDLEHDEVFRRAFSDMIEAFGATYGDPTDFDLA